MSDAGASLTANVAAASATLRETTKWMVGGVVATAAGIFAGSSLTRLGSLSAFEDTARLTAAIVGIAIGFAGLAILMHRALAVLAVDFITLRMLAGDKRFAKTAAIINDRYQGQLPGKAGNLAELVAMVDAAFEDRPAPASVELLQDTERVLSDVTAEARFVELRSKFNSLVWWLRISAPLAIAGFLLFAWAANPPAGAAPSAAAGGSSIEVRMSPGPQG